MKFFIVSDCHGNIDGLFRALEKKKIINSFGNRIVGTDVYVLSIGDLANCVEDSTIGDISCLSLVGDVFDSILLGNHELPYLDPSNSFSGFYWDSEVNKEIQRIINNDLMGAAFLVGNTLISHAGISNHFNVGNSSAEEIFNKIEDHWNAKNYGYSLFSAVGYSRGGRNEVGGILWCDFENEFVPTKFPQIVGHTPKYIRMKDNSLCIDVGAKDQETEPFILELV